MTFDHGQRASFEEATALAGVAGGTDLIDLNQQCIAVAVQGHTLDVLHMAGGVALAPVFLTGTGPEGHAPGGERAAQSLIVHVADHQHLVGVVLLHDCGDQTFGIAPEARGDAGVEFSGIVVYSVCHICLLYVDHPQSRYA